MERRDPVAPVCTYQSASITVGTLAVSNIPRDTHPAPTVSLKQARMTTENRVGVERVRTSDLTSEMTKLHSIVRSGAA
jgi:hypothetical protein